MGRHNLPKPFIGLYNQQPGHDEVVTWPRGTLWLKSYLNQQRMATLNKKSTVFFNPNDFLYCINR